ncbi:uncharacterized protein [Eurosta solidaginis]|uniref:uncharacterized protein n=1 Tax=Eurosta solidaginis TaxID=178769 RepID=UPI003531011A
MDLNHKIIEAVRQCPLLYKNSASLADRKCGWEQIAQEMKMQEAILKTRWHFLREHYKRNVLSGSQIDAMQFPYKKEMEFLLPYLRPKQREEMHPDETMPKNIIKPEFVITQEDLENDSGNEEYVFLEVDAVATEYEENNEVIQQTNQNDLRKESEQETEQRPQQNDANGTEKYEVEIEMQGGGPEMEEQRNENNVEQLIDMKPDINKVQQATCNKNGSKEEEAVRTQIQEATVENIDAKVEIREKKRGGGSVGNDNTSKEDEDRCEDAIFGELVSAMLRRMPAEKKRCVKRDIMNLLLT